MSPAEDLGAPARHVSGAAPEYLLCPRGPERGSGAGSRPQWVKEEHLNFTHSVAEQLAGNWLLSSAVAVRDPPAERIKAAGGCKPPAL